MCNRHSGVMFALYCANTKIKMQAAHVKYTKDKHIFFTHFVFLEPCGLRHDFGRICKTFPKLAHYLPLECYVLFCKFNEMVQLRMCHNLGGLAWRQCMENGVASSIEDVNISTCHISIVLRSLCQMLKRMKYHIYQPRLVPNYTFSRFSKKT